ncbi:hypothetical protein MRX96_027493 [Rhipicephalus microplus]
MPPAPEAEASGKLATTSILAHEAGVVLLVTASSAASTSSPLQDAAPAVASSQQQQTSESGTNLAECKDLRAKVHRAKCRRRRKPKCWQARSDDDDFLGEVKSSTASANIIAFCPRAASPSAEAGDAATTTASSQQQHTGESDANLAEFKDLRAILHRNKCHRHRKPKCRQARSDDDYFFGEVKSSTASANITAFRPRAVSQSSEAGVPLETASSEASTSLPLQDAATTTASSQQQQTGESGRNQAECKDLRAKVHRTKYRRRRKLKCRQARSDDDYFFGEVKSSTASANITAFRPRAASQSAEAGVPLVTASSEASTSSPLQDAATTTASSQQRQTGERGRNLA